MSAQKSIFDVSAEDPEILIKLENESDEDGKVDEEDEYNCETCNVSFASLEQHIKKYHPQQDIVIQMQTESDESKDVEHQISDVTEVPLYRDGHSEIEDDELQYDVEYLEDDEEVEYETIIADYEEETPKANDMPLSKTYKMVKEEDCLNKNDGLWENETVVKSKTVKTNIVSSHKFICDICQCVWDTSRGYTNHMKTHMENPIETTTNPAPTDKFKCDVCNTIFLTNKSLRLHLRMHDPIITKVRQEELLIEHDQLNSDFEDGISRSIKKTFYCTICEKSYDTQFHTIHMRMHSSDPKFQCETCNKQFNSEANLEMHMNAHREIKPTRSKNEEEQMPGKKYACGYCGRSFSRPHEKVKHERIHTGEKPHACDICGKTFRVAYCLTLHMRTHTGARPYVCPHCNKRFKAHSVYNHHLNTHSDQRPYQCPFCPKAFKTSVQLAGHKNSHTKPFSCTECNRPFATLYSVRAHMETHKKPNHNLKHRCSICGATYARSFALRDHIKEQHTDVEQPTDFMDQIAMTACSYNEPVVIETEQVEDSTTNDMVNDQQDVIYDDMVEDKVLLGDEIIYSSFGNEEIVTE